MRIVRQKSVLSAVLSRNVDQQWSLPMITHCSTIIVIIAVCGGFLFRLVRSFVCVCVFFFAHCQRAMIALCVLDTTTDRNVEC